jgi:hypothetical protein
MPRQSRDRRVPEFKTPLRPYGTTNANIQIPAFLHETMKTLRHLRRTREMADVKLCRLYREAVEQYINSAPQQELLEECKDATPKKPSRGGRRASRAAGATRVAAVV